jgi:putative membrane protein
MAKLATARWVIMAATSIVSLGACSHWPGHRGGETSPAMMSSASPAAEKLSDANIAAILLAANNTDISYARLAPSRAQSAAVKAFAERMLADHTGVNQMVTDLLTKIDLDPVDDKISLDFRDESANKRDILRDLDGRAFDSTYIRNEIDYHVKLLGSIDTVLLPSARNAQLKQLITNVRPAVAAHLAHARQVQGSLATK